MLFVTKGVLRLTATVLVCLILAMIGYAAIIAVIFLFPPHAIH
ncbi:hypothetical protein [Dyella sp. 20L07]